MWSAFGLGGNGEEGKMYSPKVLPVVFNYSVGSGAGRIERHHLCLSSMSLLSSMKATPLVLLCVTRSGPMKGFGVKAGEGKSGGCSFIH